MMGKGIIGQLTPERWRQIQERLDTFDDLPMAQRAEFLEDIGREDSELRRQVETLLASDTQLDEVLEKPVFPICTEHLDDGLLVPRIGPYKLIRELGEGGMGTVYLATQEEPFRRRVALKLIQPDVSNRDTIKRFQSERQILARIRHPNVAQLYDGGTTPDGRPYFVMEYVEGQPIHEYCDTHRLTIHQRLELVIQVCSAVHLAHQKLRVIHRDLKPRNILVTEEGVPKLLDFGIAKDLDTASGSRTQPSVWVPHYSSPEQLAGLPLTTASDIYSLGVLLYRLLTGRLPYRPKNAEPETIRQAIRDQELVRPSTAVLSTDSRVEGGRLLKSSPETISRARRTRPSQLKRRLSGDIDAIVLKALATDPEGRYASVDRLAADIRRHLRSLPVKARVPTLRYVTGKFIRRYRFGIAATALISLILLASSWAVTTVRQREVAAKARAERTIDLLDKMIAVFDPDAAEERMTPVEFLNRARQQIREDLHGDPELLADLLSGSLAKVYRELGHLEETESVFFEALVILRTLYPEGHPRTAETLNNIGAIHFRKGQYAEAEELYREAFEMRQRLGFNDTELISSRSNLVAVLAFQNHFEEAEGIYVQLVETLEKLNDKRKLIRNLRNFGMMYFAWGKQDRAESLLRRALEEETAENGADSLLASSLHSTLGRVLFAQGELEAAEQEIQRALNTQRLRLDPTHVTIARSERNLATVLLEEGALDTASVALTNARAPLHIAKRSPDDYEIAELDSLLGVYLAKTGDYEAAEICLIDSYDSLRASKGENIIFTRQVGQRLLSLYESWGKLHRAAEFEKSISHGSKNDESPHE